jgi:hypothetical protein
MEVEEARVLLETVNTLIVAMKLHGMVVAFVIQEILRGILVGGQTLV